MASITIRNLPDQSKESLRVQAAKSGISLEAHVRRILQEASGAESIHVGNLLDLAHHYFGAHVSINLDLPQRGSQRGSPRFGS